VWLWCLTPVSLMSHPCVSGVVPLDREFARSARLMEHFEQVIFDQPSHRTIDRSAGRPSPLGQPFL